jgi:long-chain acyl-CoA synthetase
MIGSRLLMPNALDEFNAIAARLPDAVAVEFCHRHGVDETTFAGLADLAEGVGAELRARGVGPGDRCAILSENDARWIAAYFGILRLGAVAVPLDTAYHEPQVRTLLGDSQSKVLLASPRHLETARAAAAALDPQPRVLCLSGPAADVGPLTAAGATSRSRTLPPCPASESDPAVMLYTSGTTSDPKGVVLTHGNLLAERTGAFRVIYVDERDAILGVLPLFHALAQLANLFLPLTRGARVVFLETVNSTEILRAFRERRITAFCVVPQFYYLLHQRIMERVRASGPATRAAFRAMLAINTWGRSYVRVNLGRLLFPQAHDALGGRMRILVSGGSRFDPKIGRDLYGMGFNILQAYGLTECSGAATVTRPGDPHVDTVGPPFDLVEIRIERDEAAPQDREHADGEVLIRGPIVMAGYHNKPEANAAALAGGWLHTGDLGYLTTGGRLVITGRKKEIIVLASGKNIYPEEVEAHYAQSAFIKELCVLGIAVPGEPSAERLHAIIVPDLELMRERRIVNFREIIRFDIESLSLPLPHHKRVLSFDVWLDDLPRTTTRKLKRHEIDRLYRERKAGAERPPAEAEWSEGDQLWAADAKTARILATIRSAVPRGASVTPGANLELDLGLDSMERVELLSRLEHEFGVDVDEKAAQRILTVRDLVDAINPLASGAAAAPPAEVDPWARVLIADEADPVLAAVLRPKPLFAAIAYTLVRTLHLLARASLGLRVEGLDRLPSDGAYVISPNHQSYLDAFLLVGALPYRAFRRLFFVGASEYFETPFMRKLAEAMNVVPVDPDANLLRAMQAGAFGLRHGLVLMLFPEGERSPDGSPRRFKKGAAITALQTRAPIVPVALQGLFEIWPRGRGLRWSAFLPWSRTRCAIRFGPPIAPDATPQGGAERYERHTELLKSAVVEMWNDLNRQART